MTTIRWLPTAVLACAAALSACAAEPIREDGSRDEGIMLDPGPDREACRATLDCWSACDEPRSCAGCILDGESAWAKPPAFDLMWCGWEQCPDVCGIGAGEPCRACIAERCTDLPSCEDSPVPWDDGTDCFDIRQCMASCDLDHDPKCPSRCYWDGGTSGRQAFWKSLAITWRSCEDECAADDDATCAACVSRELGVADLDQCTERPSSAGGDCTGLSPQAACLCLGLDPSTC